MAVSDSCRSVSRKMCPAMTVAESSTGKEVAAIEWMMLPLGSSTAMDWCWWAASVGGTSEARKSVSVAPESARVGMCLNRGGVDTCDLRRIIIEFTACTQESISPTRQLAPPGTMVGDVDLSMASEYTAGCFFMKWHSTPLWVP